MEAAKQASEATNRMRLVAKHFARLRNKNDVKAVKICIFRSILYVFACFSKQILHIIIFGFHNFGFQVNVTRMLRTIAKK